MYLSTALHKQMALQRIYATRLYVYSICISGLDIDLGQGLQQFVDSHMLCLKDIQVNRPLLCLNTDIRSMISEGQNMSKLNY